MKTIVVDMDGTLANGDHRIHHITTKPKNWTNYFAACDKDIPISHMIEILRAMKSIGYHIIVASGRSDEVRDKTEAWLVDHKVPWDVLIMRKAGDHTPDDELKVSWLREGLIVQDNVLCVFDDRDRVVKAWRDAGLPCLQVAPGDF